MLGTRLVRASILASGRSGSLGSGGTHSKLLPGRDFRPRPSICKPRVPCSCEGRSLGFQAPQVVGHLGPGFLPAQEYGVTKGRRPCFAEAPRMRNRCGTPDRAPAKAGAQSPKHRRSLVCLALDSCLHRNKGVTKGWRLPLAFLLPFATGCLFAIVRWIKDGFVW